ncbi:MAG: ATP-binding cassette domain-containing protein, partial [bacterium]|nr:ATP-binding cassette domain-containing protein [bacterium]
MPILSTKNLEKHFDGVHAVDHLSLQFEPGKVASLIGPNGSGKSTLINTITGIHKMDGGTIVVGGRTILSKVTPYDIPTYEITRTFQDVRLFEQMTVLDNILVVLTERNIGEALFEKHKTFHLEKVEEVLTRVGLWDPPSHKASDGQGKRKQDHLASELSYGQRKLLEIARVLAMTHSPTGEAEIFFFDEPFAGLFPEMIKIVTSVIKELRDKGKTIILVEHNMDIIRALSD